MSLKPKVALSQDFLLNLAKLPAAVQGKVLKWAIRFQTDPTWITTIRPIVGPSNAS